MDVNHGLLEDIEAFYADYYREDIAKLAQHYPSESSLWVDYQDLWRFNPDLADDLRNNPTDVLDHMREGIDMVDIPLEVDLTDATPRVTNLPADHVHAPADLRHDHADTYLGLRGTLSKATGVVDRPVELTFECTKGHKRTIPQFGTDLQEPNYCDQCGGTPNWRILEHEGEWTDQMKIKVETPPDETGAIEGGEITGYVRHDLVEFGSEFGLAGRTGEQVRVYGVIRREQRDERGASGLEFDRYMDVRAVEFVNDDSDIDTDSHEQSFRELAASDDPIALWKASIAPELYATPEWDRAFELGVAYLFAAPRIDVPDGPTYRGDIHMLIVSDYGMGKSTFTQGIAEYSPKCIKKSATGLASDVGLTASAVRDDDFGEGSWTLKPGILVRGNGGHVVLDEIDKGPDDLAKMNDALEGEQTVTVDKAGKDATFNSKVGLLATGNPTDGKFEPNTAVAPQIGVDSSLLSRFDGIVTMRDRPDEEIDGNVSQRIGDAYREAQEVAFEDRDELDVLERPVPADVGRAWVKYAREHCHPQITAAQVDDIRDWYATEIRQINEQLGDETASVDPPVPVTPRVVEDTMRVAVAFARVELRDEVADHNLSRAKELIKTLAGQTFDGEKFVNRHAREGSQQADVDAVTAELRAQGQASIADLDDAMTLPKHRIEHFIEKLSQQGTVYQPETGTYELA